MSIFLLASQRLLMVKGQRTGHRICSCERSCILSKKSTAVEAPHPNVYHYHLWRLYHDPRPLLDSFDFNREVAIRPAIDGGKSRACTLPALAVLEGGKVPLLDPVYR